MEDVNDSGDEDDLLPSVLDHNITQPKDLDSMRSNLAARLQAWELLRAFHMPDSPSLALDPDSIERHPESITITMPSSYSTDERKEYGLDDLATIERRIREGQAHDALGNLRVAIKRRYLASYTKTNRKSR